MSLGTGCGSLDKATQVTFWQTQLPVDYLDTSLTINTWETVAADLSENSPARLLYIQVEQTNNGAAVETLELEITVNGTAYTWTLTGIASGVISYCYLGMYQTAGDFTPIHFTAVTMAGTNPTTAIGVPFTAATVGLIRVRQTTGVDVVAAQIEVNIAWDRLVSV